MQPKLWWCLPALCCAVLQPAKAQDTTYRYTDQDGQVTTDPARMVYLRKSFKVNGPGNIRAGAIFYHSLSGKKRYEGFYSDDSMRYETGEFRFYREDGSLESVRTYRGNRIEQTGYYENGKVAFVTSFDEANQPGDSRTYDSSGQLITEFINERVAAFPGGLTAWRDYLVKELMRKQPAYPRKEPANSITTVVDFTIDTTGNVAQARISVSSGYKAQDEHALEIIRKSPRWMPAIRNNRKVIYRQRQQITYTAKR
jgi:TonB family protein